MSLWLVVLYYTLGNRYTGHTWRGTWIRETSWKLHEMFCFSSRYSPFSIGGIILEAEIKKNNMERKRMHKIEKRQESEREVKEMVRVYKPCRHSAAGGTADRLIGSWSNTQLGSSHTVFLNYTEKHLSHKHPLPLPFTLPYSERQICL